jgi:RNA-directed DNA polymerase
MPVIPSASMPRVNQQGGQNVKQIIAELTPVLRGWGNYFRTGNAS